MTVFFLALYLYGHDPIIIPRPYLNHVECVEAGKYAVRDIKSRSDYALGHFVCVPWRSDTGAPQ